MRRIILILSLILIPSASYANTVSLHTVSNDNTLAAINDNFTNVANRLNGDIDGSTDGGSTTSNLAQDTVFEINMADDANPRLRDSELLSVTTDSTTAQNTFVYSGGIPADDTDLTSNISACVAYINGYRVSKAATAQTYTASRDNWLDLSQTGVYTVTAVTVGAAEPAVAANSARLAKVTTDGTEITAITDEANRRLPGLVVPSHYRSGLVVSRDSTTTVTVGPGTAEINNTMVSKTSTTTLTISTAGDYASGSSERAADKFGFVLMSAAGALKLDVDDPPSYDNYGVSTTAGKLRYDTYHSTVYRVLGWFYLDGNGSGNVEVASNLKEGDVHNAVQSNDTNSISYNSATYVDIQKARFYCSGGPVQLMAVISGDASGGGVTRWEVTHNFDTADLADSAYASGIGNDLYPVHMNNAFLHQNVAQGSHTYKTRSKIPSAAVILRGRRYIIQEL